MLGVPSKNVPLDERCDECGVMADGALSSLHSQTPEMQQMRTRSGVCVTCQCTKALIHVAVHGSWHRHLWMRKSGDFWKRESEREKDRAYVLVFLCPVCVTRVIV